VESQHYRRPSAYLWARCEGLVKIVDLVTEKSPRDDYRSLTDPPVSSYPSLTQFVSLSLMPPPHSTKKL